MATRCILFFDTMWGSALDRPDGLPEHYQLTADRQCFGTADAVVFHIPQWRYGHGESMPGKPPGQIWVAWSMECEENYPLLRDAAFMRHFDFSMTYRLDSDFPVTYVSQSLDTALRAPGQVSPSQGLVAAFISSPYNRSGRQAYFQELARWLSIDSYGKFLRNRTLPADVGQASKLTTLAGYKFTLAFENACARDYVTEKFFDPLTVGSVPIYLGAPNIADFAPGEHCYIDVRDFADPRSLARHIEQLGADEAAYRHYLDWRQQPFRSGFQDLLAQAARHPFVRLCEGIEARLAARASAS
ncbi:MAG TPA: glycosyltransferase family 10 [Rhodoferax sp.]|nr:glycosyltransferase family 10 [Rhodoferax sp.]